MASKQRQGAPSSRAKSRGGAGKKDNSEAQPSTELPEVEQLSWKIISEKKASLLSILPIRDVARELASILALNNSEDDLREAAILDYYVAGYWFSRENKFTNEQSSAFFTLLHSLLNGLKDEDHTLAGSVEQLKNFIGGIGLSDQTSLRCFTEETAHLAIQYITDSLFQHYHLFEILLCQDQEQENLNKYMDISMPPALDSLCPAPLEEAISEELYNRLFNPQVVSPEEDKVTEENQTESVNGVPDHSTADAILLRVDPEEIKAMMNTMASETFSSYKDQMLLKLKNREEQFTSKLTHMKKT